MAKAFEYLRNTNLKALEVGKFEIDGSNIFALVSEYQTKLPENAKPESHLQYIDIQFIISGIEKIGYAAKLDQIESELYNPNKDISFYKTDVDTFILHEGSFAIFYPTDLHAPCIQYASEPNLVKKVVVKVKLD